MTKSNQRYYLLALTAALACAQGSLAAAPTKEGDDVISLDKVVVSAGLQDRTAFDLAQGTSILSGAELDRRVQDTIGESLSAVPGVNSTYYGPGASRPIIRGQGGDRIRVLANGVGALDASNISPDHNTALEPLFASRIEVLRGPSTLLYGSSAIGGVVNVIDNSVPTTLGDGHFHGAVEGRFFGAASERTGVASVEENNSNLAVHVNALKTKTDDIDIPGGTLASSAIDTRSFATGVTAFGKVGYLGIGVNRYETTYGVPTGEEPPVTIDMSQTRFDLLGGITQPFGVFQGAKLRVDYGRYRHSELDGDEIATTFHNKAWEGRLELPHQAIGNLTGTIGLQAARSDFSALGEEVVTPPSRTQSQALFALEELKQDKITFQFGARYERETVKLGYVDPALPALPGYASTTGAKRTFNGLNGSLGVVYYPVKDYSIGASLTYSERLPTAQELFSNGPHGGTDAYEIGTTGLGREKSVGVEVSLRKRAGWLTGSIGVFANRFEGYIFEQQLADDAVPVANNADGLTNYQFIAKNAEFYGAEGEVSFHLMDSGTNHLHFDLMSDYVHAEQTTNDEPLPRIPPMRFGASLRFQNAKWGAGVEVRHSLRQDRIADTETETPGYTLLGAYASYLVMTGPQQLEIFVRGENLTDETARVHSSFLKDTAPLAGRGVTAGVRLTF